jgi:hypothetical protein
MENLRCAHRVPKVVSRLKETKFAREGIMLDKYEYKWPVKP